MGAADALGIQKRYVANSHSHQAYPTVKSTGGKSEIILPSMPLDDDSIDIDVPELPDIEVPIKKKKA